MPTPFDADRAWQQLLARDPEGQFFYGVATTGVFCRPGCQSRRPLRANVRFFATAAAAQAAGFRPCQRCRPTTGTASSTLLDKIRMHIEQNLDRAVPLAELGRIAGLSPFTVQRLFKQQMGTSPAAYQRALRARALRAALKSGGTVTEAIYQAGFSSTSRASAGAQLGMTPSRFVRGGQGEQIGHATAETEFGWMIAAATARGLCWLALASTQSEAEEGLRSEFPLATLHADPALSSAIAAALATVHGQARSGTDELPLDLRGTAFQLKVWQALRAIPRGESIAYGQLARQMAMPKATRAVAHACALNRVALLVPCHRVVGAGGALTGYRWGVERKQKLLAAEGVRGKN